MNEALEYVFTISDHVKQAEAAQNFAFEFRMQHGLPTQPKAQYELPELSKSQTAELDELCRKHNIGKELKLDFVKLIQRANTSGDENGKAIHIDLNNTSDLSAAGVKFLKALKKLDTDGNGHVSLDELAIHVESTEAVERERGLLKKGVTFLGGLVFLLVGSMLAMGIVAGEAVKESHIESDVMTNLQGDLVKVGVAKANFDLFGIPSLSIEAISRLERTNVFLDGTDDPGYANKVVEASFGLTNMFKLSEHEAILITESGDKITIDALTKTANVTIGTGSYRISDGSTDMGQDSTDAGQKGRRELRRGSGFLSTSGSFILSSGGGNAHQTGG